MGNQHKPMERQILAYLLETYHPHTVITYGSFVSGTEADNSDFDVLLVGDGCPTKHDGSVVNGVLLDAFVYQTEDFLEKSKDPEEFIQAHDGRLVLDERGLGAALLERLEEYIAKHAVTDANTRAHLRDWCAKMLERARTGDPDGMLRWHWLIYDSLEIYCNLRDQFYFGPKKTMAFLREQEPDGYALLEKALYTLEFSALETWIGWVTAGGT